MVGLSIPSHHNHNKNKNKPKAGALQKIRLTDVVFCGGVTFDSCTTTLVHGYI